MKKAFITGATGQDASYLIELLLLKGYEVHGLVRRSSFGYGNLRNILHLVNDESLYRRKLFLHAGDILDASSLYRIINEVGPDEIYNLAAMADVQESFLMPEYTIDVNGVGVVRILEAIRKINPKIKFYQASTSELFGEVEEQPQSEKTRFNPQSPYAIGKQVGFQITKRYREGYGLFACNGILFNHESPRRGDDFVTRKVTRAVARIKYGLQNVLRLGNLDAHRDWGFAGDFVEAMWMMMQKDAADDYCIGTGETHTVHEWVEECFKYAGLEWNKYVVIDPRLFRPLEVDSLQCDYSKAREELKWEPSIKFHDLIKMMMEADLEEAKKEADLYALSCLTTKREGERITLPY